MYVYKPPVFVIPASETFYLTCCAVKRLYNVALKHDSDLCLRSSKEVRALGLEKCRNGAMRREN